MSKARFFFAILCVTAVVSVYAQDSSPEPSADSCNELTDCTSCTGNLECGWCVSLKKCLPGNETGPANGGCLLWDYKTCPFDECERHEDCLACTLAGGECGWCNSRSTQAVCVSGNSTGPYAANAQCPIWDYEVMTCSAAKQCAEYDTCETCANDTTCGWCSDGSSPRCSAGNASQPYEGTCNRWSYGEAACKESCFSLTTCDACKKANGCGWCNATSVCMPGGEDGPTSGTCEVDKWYYTKCPATPLKGCGASKNCTDCVSNTRCGWCVNNGVCYPTGEAPEDCTFFRTGNCKDPCTDKKTCYSCGSDPDCGWCNSTGCVSGTSSGPAAGSCNEWIKNPSSCNNTNCTDFLNCEACTQSSNTHCGWCEYTRPYKCLYIANPPPQPGDPTCQFNWYYGNCPAPRDCRDYTSCGQCTAAECWWCVTNGCRDKKLFQNCFQTPSQCNPRPPTPGGDGDLSDGEIAGIVIGSIAGAVLLVSLGVLVWYRFYWLRKHYYEVLR